MAEAAVMDVETGGFPPLAGPVSDPPAKAKTVGRPAGYKPFNNEVTPEDFFVMLNAIDDADWPKSLVYVWRRDPFTDNTNGGREPKYVDVINRAVKESNIKEEHGSGSYKLQLNTNDKYVAHTILTIEDLAFPPHIPPGDWFNNPRNKKWASWKPIVEKWWKEKLSMIAGPQAPTVDNAAVGELTRLVSQLANNNGKSNDGDKLQSVLVQWALQQTADERKADRDSDSPGKLAEMIRAMKELAPAPPPPPPAPDNTMLTFVLAQLTRLQESNDKLVQAMIAKKEDQANPMAMVNTVTDIFSKLQGFVQPVAPKEPWVDIVEAAAPGVIGALDKFATGFAMQRAMGPQQQRPQPARPMQPNPPQVIPLQPQPVAQPAGNQPPPNEPPVTTAGAEQPEMDTNQLSMLMMIAAEMAQALNLGLDGDHYADIFCFKHGQALYDQIIGQPKEQVLTVLKAIPQAWGMLQPFEPLLPEFIDSFYDYATQSEEEDTKKISEPEVEPVAPKKKTKKK